MKKFLFLIFLSMLTALSASAVDFCAVNSQGTEIAYIILGETDNVTVCQNGTVYTLCTSLTIPSEATNAETGKTYTVIGIYDNAFYGCSGMEELTLPSTLNKEYVGSAAFKACTGLKAFHGDLASSDNRCLIIDGELMGFARDGLTEYDIPTDVKTIRSGVFNECSSLTSINVPNTVTSVEDEAFYGCN